MDAPHRGVAALQQRIRRAMPPQYQISWQRRAPSLPRLLTTPTLSLKFESVQRMCSSKLLRMQPIYQRPRSNARALLQLKSQEWSIPHAGTDVWFAWSRCHEKLRLQSKSKLLLVCFTPLVVRFFILTCSLSARSPLGKRDLDAWYHRLRELWQYKEQYGDCRVPRNYKNTQLANWVHKQRHRHKSPFPLSLDQTDALNQIGFEWIVTPNSKCKEFQVSPNESAAETPSNRLDLLVLACTARGSLPPSGEALERREIDYTASRKRSAQILSDCSSDVRLGSTFSPSPLDAAVPSVTQVNKRQGSRASQSENYRVINSSRYHDALQSTNESALLGLVRLEPLPREIEAAELK
jgi:Helicase associated domain